MHSCNACHRSRSRLVVAAPLLAPVAGAAGRAGGAAATSTTTTPAGYDRRRRPGMPLAPRLQNLGVHTFPVTHEGRARAAVHQPGPEPGLRRSTTPKRRARSPRRRGSIPTLAMAYWGQALVLGPNINAPMDAEDEPKALALVQKAVALKAKATPRERAYIDALAARYTGKAEDRASGRSRLRRGDAQAGRERIPDDLDARTLYAEVADGPAAVELLDARRPAVRRDAARSQSALEHVLAQQPEPSGRAAPVDSPVGGDRHAGARRSGSRSPAAADAGRRPHRPHAGAHLSARRPSRRCRSASTSSRRRPTRTTSRSAARRGCIRSPTTRTTCTSSGWARRRAGSGTLALESAQQAGRARSRTRRSATVPILQGFLVVPYWAMVRFERVGRRSSPTRARVTRRRSRAASGTTRARWRSSRRIGSTRPSASSAQLQGARRRSGARRDRRRSRPTAASRSCGSRRK